MTVQDRFESDGHVEITPERARAGRKGVHVLAILSVSTFLAVIGLTTFFVTTTFSG